MMVRSLIFLVFVAAALSAWAQKPIQSSQPCATMDEDARSRSRFPQRGSLDEFENFIQKKIIEIKRRDATGRTQATLVSIPIIVHVVHNGEAVGTGTNLSQAQVAAQIEVLNEDFRKKAGTPGYNDNPVGADIEIEFCLSPVDENGNAMAEPGIDRYDGNQADWSRDEIENKLKPTTIWNPNLFYNVWTVKFDPVDAGLIGYAQFPDQSGLPGLQEKGGPASTDGVVIRYQSFGSVDKGNFPVMQAPYNKGRTLSHETGHWLGLRHIWGDGNCAEDFVSDTPPASGPSSGCPVGRISCGGVNMVQNYMDYSEDACMNIFTEGQKNRMRAVIENSPRRQSLIQANLCSPVVADVPDPNFMADKLECVLLGSEVTFTDLSSNFPNAWQWTFEGGDPNTSTDRNPKVVYNTPGSFDVTLTVTNSLGSATLTLNDYIVVSEEGLCRDFTNFLPGFTPSVLPLSQFGSYTGYLTGHNSPKTTAFSEFFINNCGYKYVSGVSIKFGVATSTIEDAKVHVTVWNARGAQSSPGSVIERKEVLLKQIKEDVANNVATEITFDRETPIFSRPFHVGVEIEYNKGYTLAITSSANGEATNATSWVKKANGMWELFTIAFGANIAMDIRPHVGVNPSVQVAASKQLIYPREKVTLNGRGASIFVWNSDDGAISNVPGPQIIVTPTETTTYTTTGSGLDLCHSTALTTIYVREENVVGTEPDLTFASLSLFPNPGSEQLQVYFENPYRGDVELRLSTVVGSKIYYQSSVAKQADEFDHSISTNGLPAGLYVVQLRLGNKVINRKWVKR
jgi:PKD repeat protein